MCNACGSLCCALGSFSGCGCEDCENPDCWNYCEFCEQPAFWCICDDDDPLPLPDEAHGKSDSDEMAVVSQAARAAVEAAAREGGPGPSA